MSLARGTLRDLHALIRRTAETPVVSPAIADDYFLSLDAGEDLFAQETSTASNFQRQHDDDFRVMSGSVTLDSAIPPNGVDTLPEATITERVGRDKHECSGLQHEAANQRTWCR
jgi:hypothetical protein